jgi:hypothetical protein
VPEKFLADIKLMRDNCELFCTTRYPELIPAADEIYKIAQTLSKALFESIVKFESSPSSDLTAPSNTAVVSPQDEKNSFTVCVRLMDKSIPYEVLPVAASSKRVLSSVRYLIRVVEYEQAIKTVNTRPYLFS